MVLQWPEQVSLQFPLQLCEHPSSQSVRHPPLHPVLHPISFVGSITCPIAGIWEANKRPMMGRARFEALLKNSRLERSSCILSFCFISVKINCLTISNSCLCIHLCKTLYKYQSKCPYNYLRSHLYSYDHNRPCRCCNMTLHNYLCKCQSTPIRNSLTLSPLRSQYLAH